MYTPLKLAVLALPFVSARSPNFKSRSTLHTRGLLTGIATDASDVADQVNAALGNILPIPVDSSDLLQSTLDNIRQQGFEFDVLEETFAGLLQAVVARYVPTSIPDALAQIDTILNGSGSTIENVAQLLLDGLATTDLTQNVLAAYLSDINSFNNVNPDPPTVIYPRKSPQDAPYTVPEAQLRAAIYIPPGFTNGQTKRPVLFVPGTGAFGGVNFISNLGKLLANDGRFDPVYLNVPGAMYMDAQINSEYIAYAINYLGSITSNSPNANDLAVIPWSQGNLDTQWVLQYWPSTRPVVTDFISVSADFHGTTLAYFLDPAVINPPLPPSVIQQEYDSNYVLTLRYGGGGSPYVNSTSVHSITDEVVQPQYSPYASADYFTRDLPGTPDTTSVCPALQNVAYTNNEIQQICPGQPAGGPYTHEGLLYNPLMYALTLDALTHDGPGRVERIDLPTVCAQIVAPGLTLADVAATEGLIPLAIINFLLYPGKVTSEPAVMQYALQANAQCAAGNMSTTAGVSSSTVATSATTTTATEVSASSTPSPTTMVTATSTGITSSTVDTASTISGTSLTSTTVSISTTSTAVAFTYLTSLTMSSLSASTASIDTVSTSVPASTSTSTTRATEFASLSSTLSTEAPSTTGFSISTSHTIIEVSSTSPAISTSYASSASSASSVSSTSSPDPTITSDKVITISTADPTTFSSSDGVTSSDPSTLVSTASVDPTLISTASAETTPASISASSATSLTTANSETVDGETTSSTSSATVLDSVTFSTSVTVSTTQALTTSTLIEDAGTTASGTSISASVVPINTATDSNTETTTHEAEGSTSTTRIYNNSEPATSSTSSTTDASVASSTAANTEIAPSTILNPTATDPVLGSGTSATASSSGSRTPYDTTRSIPHSAIGTSSSMTSNPDMRITTATITTTSTSTSTSKSTDDKGWRGW